jgi:radical SAM protein with 4Fe4S-binding SPASM domain
MEIINLVNKTKTNNRGELIVILFEKCNLSCLMCMQDHSDETGIDTIREKLFPIQKSLDGLKSKGKVSSAINLMGGELFEDSLPDSVFEDYLFLVEEIRSYSEKINFPVDIQISTNLVWNKTSRIKEFLDRSGIKITVSYDPAGRFNPITFDKFKENVKKFKDYISQIGVVMTKPSIELFLKKQTPFFDYLYDNFEIVFDHYSPEIVGYKSINDYKKDSIADSLNPTDVILREFYKFMYDNWPRCHPFNELSLNGLQSMFCMSTITIPPDSSITSCEKYEVKNNKPIKIVFGQLNKMKEKWFDDYDCFSCEHMQRCSMGCFANHLRDGRTQKECWLKEVYDYVDSEKK